MSLRPVKYIPERNDQHAEKLWADFCKHRDAVQKEDPSKTDEMQIYKGWSLQMIANLQLMVFDLVEDVQKLTLEVHAGRKRK